MGHTPGEWKYELYDPSAKTGLVTVAHVGDYRVGVETGTPSGNYRDAEFGHDKDDARLIAAAPALLEAIQGLLAGGNNIPASAWDKVETALSLAQPEPVEGK